MPSSRQGTRSTSSPSPSVPRPHVPPPFPVADAPARGVSAGLAAAALQAALKAHEDHRHDAAKMLEQINETLWTTSPDGQEASVLYGRVPAETGVIEYAAAGRVSAVVVHEAGHIVLASGAPPLGVDLDMRLNLQRHVIPAGGLLVVASDGVLASGAPPRGPRSL